MQTAATKTALACTAFAAHIVFGDGEQQLSAGGGGDSNGCVLEQLQCYLPPAAFA